MPRAARRRPSERNGYCIYYISAVAVRGATPCRTSTKSGTPGRTTRADDNNGDTVAAGSANNDGIRGRMEQLRPGRLSRSVRPARQPAERAAMPQTPPSRRRGRRARPLPAARRRRGAKAAGTLPGDATRVLRRQHGGHVAQKVAAIPQAAMPPQPARRRCGPRCGKRFLGAIGEDSAVWNTDRLPRSQTGDAASPWRARRHGLRPARQPLPAQRLSPVPAWRRAGALPHRP